MIYQKLVTSISAYVLGRNNMRNKEFSSFSSISFYGSIVNKYFNPSAKFDFEKSTFNVEEGSSIRILKPFCEVDGRYQLESDLVLTLGVIEPSMPTSSNHNLGELYSMLRLQRETCWTLDDVLTLYLKVYRLFSFFNFRSNITFEKITLSALSDGKYYPVGDLFVNSKFPCTNIHETYTITHASINEKIVDLYNFLEIQNKLLCFIPENDEASRTVDYDSYMLTCAVFEKLYSLSYSDKVLKITNPIHLEVRSRIISALQDIVSSSEGEYLSEATSYLTRFVHKNERTLADRFAYCLDQNKEILDNVFPSKKLTPNIISKISSAFSSQRNAFDHGNFEKILAFSVPPYSYAIILIYVMILRQVGVDDPTITHIVKRMFWNYSHQDPN